MLLFCSVGFAFLVLVLGDSFLCCGCCWVWILLSLDFLFVFVCLWFFLFFFVLAWTGGFTQGFGWLLLIVEWVDLVFVFLFAGLLGFMSFWWLIRRMWLFFFSVI